MNTEETNNNELEQPKRKRFSGIFDSPDDDFDSNGESDFRESDVDHTEPEYQTVEIDGDEYDVLVEEETEETSPTKINITFAHDMLWQDSSEDDYDADATETNFASEVERTLYQNGYDVTVEWGGVTSMTIQREDGQDVGNDYNHIRGIIDSIDVDYVAMPEIEDFD